MKIKMAISSFLLMFLSINCHADVTKDFDDIKAIVSSQNLRKLIKPTQKLKSIVRVGESFDIRLLNSDGSCELYNAMVLGQFSRARGFNQEAIVDELPQSCD
jgi:hypothetical protein